MIVGNSDHDHVNCKIQYFTDYFILPQMWIKSRHKYFSWWLYEKSNVKLDILRLIHVLCEKILYEYLESKKSNKELLNTHISSYNNVSGEQQLLSKFQDMIAHDNIWPIIQLAFLEQWFKHMSTYIFLHWGNHSGILIC